MTERTWWWRIGGSNAVTVWSWWVTLPLGLMASLYGGILQGVALGPWIGAVLLVHIGLIAPLVLVRATYLSSRPRRSRPGLALTTFAVMGASRSLVLVAVASELGVADVSVVLIEWPVMGAVGSAFALSITAIVVDSVREHRAVTERLLELQDSIRRISEFEGDRLADLEAKFVQDVEAQVIAALEQVRSSQPTSGQAAGQSLRAVSEAVVRPLSHQLADAELWSPAAFSKPQGSGPKGVSGYLRMIGPGNTLGPALAFEATVLPFMVSQVGPGFALINFVVATAILFLLGLLVRRIWPKSLPPGVNIIGLAATYSATLAATALVVLGLFSVLGAVLPPFWTGLIVYPALVLVWSLLYAVFARRKAIEIELAESLSKEAQVAERLRSHATFVQRRMAKLLHSIVQGELVASAVAISRTRDRGAVAAEIERVTASIVERLHSDEVSTDSRERILDLVSLWSAALVVDADVSANVWDLLDSDPDLQEAVVDVLAEGLTNAVRHGSGPRVVIHLRQTHRGVDVVVQSQGSLREKAAGGLGLRTISESARTWSLEEHSGVVHLSASLAS